MYSFQEIDDKETWNSFITRNSFEFYTFLQSWEWWEVQKELWKDIIRFWIYTEQSCIWQALILKIRAKRWSYLFMPHGPLVQSQEADFFDVMTELLKELQKLAKAEKFDFIRCNSPIKNTRHNKNSFKKLWFIDAPMHEHVEDTHLLDISISEEDLLKNMKKWDRYYINRAQKEWVEIRIGNDTDHIQSLIDMHESHSKRTNGKHTYTPFTESFTRSLYKHFDDNISTISATYNGHIESILMTIRFWDVCVYYIAASDIRSHKFSPNYLCQWEAIKNAKSQWCTLYNFWWVSPDDNPKHPIAGVTKFKRKFAWYDHSLLHAQDFPITPKYWGNYIIETIRRKKRGYYYKKLSD